MRSPTNWFVVLACASIVAPYVLGCAAERREGVALRLADGHFSRVDTAVHGFCSIKVTIGPS